MKKILAILLASMMLLSLLPAAVAESAEGPVVITAMWENSRPQNAYTDEIHDYILKALNIDLQLICVSENFTQQLALTIASGDIPDLILMEYRTYVEYANEGLFTDLTGLVDQYSDLMDYVNTGDQGEMCWNRMKVDGAIYGIPTRSVNTSMLTTAIRQDWLDNLGLQVPATIDELTEVLRAFTEDDPDQNGLNDTYGLSTYGMHNIYSMNYLSTIFGAFGAAPGQQYLLNDDGTVTTNVISDEYKAAVSYLHDIYAAGYMDPEIFTNSNSQAYEKFATGKMGFWPCWWSNPGSVYVKYGFLDKTILRLSGADKLPVENFRAGFKMVDTCAAEFAAKTPYFYSTCDGDNESAQFIAEHSDPKKKKVLVFGSGPIRIGQGIEFDYCSVHAVWTLKKHGCEAILVNNNPETVSTDFDTGDRLYFDPLNPESVDHIIAAEKPDGCLVQFGGQTAIKLAKHMDEIGLPILGTPADAIDEAEDRERFDELLERCGIPRPEGRTVFTLEEALQAAQEVGYPVLMRPSYVLGGQNMIVAYNSADVIEYMGVITAHVDMSHPVLMDKYIYGTECEVDAICDGEDYLVPGIMEQIERTGVHSGDSICVYPPYDFPQDVIDTLVDYTGRFARELKVVGLVNVQYAVQDGKVYVIEVNPRSSRTVPYISKVTGVPMVDLAVRCTLGEKLKDMGYGTGLWRNGKSPYVAVKVPVYSFLKLHGVDTMLGPEMKSTGEVLGIAPNMHEALIKGLVAAGYQFKTPGPGSCVIISVKDSDKKEAAELAWKLHDYGYKIYGTPGTARYLNSQMVPCSTVRQMSEERPNVLDLLESGLVDYIISTSPHGRDPHRDSVKFRRKATELSIPCITALDTARILVNALHSDHDISGMELVDIATLHRDAANGK